MTQLFVSMMALIQLSDLAFKWWGLWLFVLYWLYLFDLMRALFCWVCAGVHNMLIFGRKKWGHILAFGWKKETFWQLSPAIEFRTRGQRGGIIFRSSRPRFVQIQTFSLQHHRRLWWRTNTNTSVLVAPPGAKWLKRNVSLLQNKVRAHGSLRGQLKMRWLQRKGGKCRCSISMKSFLFLILLTVFQFSI